jgi:uncharacterized protein with HEPN domain
MPRDSKLYLSDILKAIARIEKSLESLDKSDLGDDDEKIDSILFNMMTIGEAAKHIPQNLRDKNPDIAWSAIGRFRDFVVHHYFDIDLDKVWMILETDIPELKQQVETLLQAIAKDDEHNANE